MPIVVLKGDNAELQSPVVRAPYQSSIAHPPADGQPFADSQPPSRMPHSSNGPQLTIPAVRLDVDRISSSMAAQLASSLVSHVLFLKSQIPL